MTCHSCAVSVCIEIAAARYVSSLKSHQYRFMAAVKTASLSRENMKPLEMGVIVVEWFVLAGADRYRRTSNY